MNIIGYRFSISLLMAAMVLSTFFAQPLGAVEYMVGEGDVLKISVYGHADLTTTERVSGEGNIIFPLLGQVGVDGLTVSGISDFIGKRLADGYIISPQVSVFVVEFRSRKSMIMGEVVKPGLYELKGRMSMLELISIAGGLTKDAGDVATIKRQSLGGKSEIITIDLAGILESGDASRDVPIYDGDSIYISRAGLFYVTGEVKKPDAYKFIEGTSVIKAITQAGGFTDKASEKKVRIIRKVNGMDEIIKNVAMDEPVLPSDVIVIPESLF